MSKPWEQEWVLSDPWSIRDAETCAERAHVFNDEQTKAESDEVASFLVAAPDMARAGMSIISGVLAGVAPVLGPISADEMVARGQPVTITAQQFAALVASLRKAGLPL